MEMGDQELQRRAKFCVTHHHGCDCREWKLRERLMRAEEVIKKIAGFSPVTFGILPLSRITYDARKYMADYLKKEDDGQENIR